MLWKEIECSYCSGITVHKSVQTRQQGLRTYYPYIHTVSERQGKLKYSLGGHIIALFHAFEQ